MSAFFAMLSRMKYIQRWSLMRQQRPETLDSHTLEVAQITHLLIALANSRFGESLDPGCGVLLALYHDASEILTGDLPTPIKYHDPTLTSAYKELEVAALDRLAGLLPEDLLGEFDPYLAPIEDALAAYLPYVKAADKLSALVKCETELASGNGEFARAKQSLLASPALELPAAKVFLEEFLPACALTLDEISPSL